MHEHIRVDRGEEVIDFSNDFVMLCEQSNISERKTRNLGGVNLLKQKRSLAFLKPPLSVLMALALLIAGLLFFWYEYRPSTVRARCSIEAEKMAGKDEFVYEIIYRHCLRKHGIEYSEQKE